MTENNAIFCPFTDRNNRQNEYITSYILLLPVSFITGGYQTNTLLDNFPLTDTEIIDLDNDDGLDCPTPPDLPFLPHLPRRGPEDGRGPPARLRGVVRQ